MEKHHSPKGDDTEAIMNTEREWPQTKGEEKVRMQEGWEVDSSNVTTRLSHRVHC